MKCLLALLTLLFTLSAAGAAPPRVEIRAHFEGFDEPGARNAKPAAKARNLLHSPRVTTKSGAPASLEIIREVAIPHFAKGGSVVNCGISVEVTPRIQDGKIILAGKCVLRQPAKDQAGKPAESLRMDVRETYFLAEAGKGKPVTIDASTGGPGRIILDVRLVNDEGQPL